MENNQDFSVAHAGNEPSLMIGATPIGMKVLVVDDEPEIVEEVIELLEDEGLSCLPASNAKRALELVARDPEICVIVTDIRMPGMDGLEMVRQINASVAQGRDLYVIVVTGHAGMNEAVEALRLGAEDFLTKPISPDHLIHSVRRAGELIKLRQNERTFQQQLEQEVKSKTADLVAINKKLVVSSRIKDDFLSVIDHEWRTPLGTIMGFAELLQFELKDDANPEVQDCLDHILKSSTHLRQTIEDILEFSNAISGGLKVSLGWHRLGDVFDNIGGGEIEKQAAAKGIHLELEPQLDDQQVQIDSAMLMKSMICLVENAIKFSPANSTVHIGLKQAGDEMTFFVKDQGPGMTEEEIEVAFRLFSQLDSGLNRREDGTGIGLCLASALSEIQGGRLDIDSTPGNGTTARVTLPYMQDPSITD